MHLAGRDAVHTAAASPGLSFVAPLGYRAKKICCQIVVRSCSAFVCCWLSPAAARVPIAAAPAPAMSQAALEVAVAAGATRRPTRFPALLGRAVPTIWWWRPLRLPGSCPLPSALRRRSASRSPPPTEIQSPDLELRAAQRLRPARAVRA